MRIFPQALMRNTLSALIALILMLPSPGGAQRKGPSFDHALTVAPMHRAAPPSAAAAQETTRVLAVMIAFQEDTDSRTSGTGSFDLSSSPSKIFDPPPRDRAYFQNHLQFTQNYFRKASDGRRIIAATLLDSVFRLPHQMQYYSPPRGSSVNTEVGLLMQDSWHIVDSLNPGYPFEQYDAFLIFHAGAGRDIDFVSILGYDPLPYDIPSLYINLAGLKKMFGNAYNGVPVKGGTFLIQNTMVIPETENHTVDGISGPALLELGINGLIAANFGSFFGLPDLFDTKTGSTGIGRFGLMDGQSIFSWNGAFPPEPSAWERIFLGWVQPVTVGSGDSVYTLPATGLAGANDVVYKVPISAKEYFLLENRNRDAQHDGSTITIVRGGAPITKTFWRDTTGFNSGNQDSLYGVIVDVDEFDWSLPGGVNSRTHELFDGGILIWHIDETIIDATIADDAVNADPAHRGVSLMEADGSQDIGQTYGFLSAGSGSENGTPLDYWYQGNPAPLRVKSNEFSPTSIPSSRSYSQANSHVSITAFSRRDSLMTARISVGDLQSTPLPGFPKLIGNVGNNSVTFTDQFGLLSPAFLVARDVVFGWTPEGRSLLAFDESGLLALFASYPLPAFGSFTGQPAVGDLNGDSGTDFIIGGNFWVPSDGPAATPSVSGYLGVDADANELADLAYLHNVSGAAVTTSVVLGDSLAAIGTERSGVVFFTRGGSIRDTVAFDTTAVVGLSLWAQADTFIAVSAGGTVALMTPAGLIVSKKFGTYFHSPASVAIFPAGKRIALGASDGSLYLLDNTLTPVSGFPLSTGGEILNAPALADIDADGQTDIVALSGNRIYGVNGAGSILDQFPITMRTNSSVAAAPIVADVDGNGTVDIVAVTREGLLVAYDKRGKMANGFPLQVGPNTGSTPAAFPIVNRACLSCDIGVGLAVASSDGHLYAWRTGTVSSLSSTNPPQFPWPQLLHDARNTGLSELIRPLAPKSSGFFPASLAYNWPNPVGKEHGFKTHIRYFLGSAARVHIRVFDMAGDLVTEFDGPGQGGLDNEVEWDVSGIQSGVYFAHIDALGAQGSGNAVIKVAVIK